MISQEPLGCCGMRPPPEGLFSVHVVHMLIDGGATGVQFAAPKPECLGASYISDTPVLPMTSGNSQTGVAVDYGMCVGFSSTPFHVLTINFIVTSQTPDCCVWGPIAFGGQGTVINVTDCDGNVVEGQGVANVVNPSGICMCEFGDQCVPLAVERSTWGAIKSLYVSIN